MLKKIFIVLFSLVLALVLIAYLLPREVSVQRSAFVEAPPEVVFDNVNSLQKWAAWSPWEGRDPEMVSTFSGPEAGVGSKHTWQSDHPQVGNGSQEITASDPYREIRTHLDFGDQGTAEGWWHFEEQEDGTNVTWGFTTDLGYNPIMRYFGLMMDDMVGGDFEAGLNKLKAVSEEQYQARSPLPDSTTVEPPASSTST